jgi:hypothetical protein
MKKILVHIKRVLLALIVMHGSVSFGQVGEVKDKKVKLVDWKANDCDNTYDPYRLINRITEIRAQNEITFLTVNFSDNCCAAFKPQVAFKANKLFLLPYKEYSGDYCTCNCCFSIEFKIAGLPTSQYETYFDGKKIEFSNDHYKVVQPTSEVYKGNTINITNRYGFKEDIWMTFYEDGNVKTLEKYPERELYNRSEPLWEKKFYRSGGLARYSRNDTTEAWFEDGTRREESVEYKRGDTTYQKEFSLYENRKVHTRSLKRTYPTILRSEFDPKFQGKGFRRETIYHEEFFQNGEFKFRFGKDTTSTWRAPGKIAVLEFNEERIEYDADGYETKRTINWKTQGPTSWGA